MKGDPRRARITFNARQKMSAWDLLRALEDDTAALAIFDPQYRAVLDKLDFGNEGQRQKKRAALQQMSDSDICLYVEQIERILKPSGYLMLWMDKYSIGSGHHLRYLRHTEWMRIVDLLCWETTRFGMGRRLRSCTEYLVILQKEPTGAKHTWSDHSMRDFCSEAAARDTHPHAKPLELTKKLINAVTRAGDLVVDPCAGSYVVLDACRATARKFVGCDLI